jgi:hypothetical protein
VIAIPRLGIEGAAIAWALSMAVENVGGLVLLIRRREIHPRGIGLAGTAGLTLATALGALLLARAIAGTGGAALAVDLGLVVLGTVGVVALRRGPLRLRTLLGRDAA